MMASWNVVSVYANVGTDFPELHKAIVDLKNVLQDFEEAFGAQVKRGEMKVRSDFAPTPPNMDSSNGSEGANGHNGSSGHRSARPTPDTAQDGANDAAPTPRNGGEPTQQQQDDLDSLFDEPEPEVEAHHEMIQYEVHPPRSLDSMTHELDAAEVEEEEVQPPVANTKADRHGDLLQPSQRYTPEHHNSTLEASSALSSPAPQHNQLPRDRVKKIREHSTESKHESRDVTSPELLRRREEYRASSTSLSTTKSNPKHAPLAVQSPQDNSDEDDLIHPSPPFSYTPALNTNTKPNFSTLPSTTHMPKSLQQISTTDLRAKYRDRKAHLNATFGGNANVPQQYRVQMAGLLSEIKAREAEELEEREGGEVGGGGGEVGGGGGNSGTPKYLGNSVLGSKKQGLGQGQGQMGSAPVAPMLHMRKESGGSGAGSASGGGGGKRGH
jgi:hypothetical protein